MDEFESEETDAQRRRSGHQRARTGRESFGEVRTKRVDRYRGEKKSIFIETKGEDAGGHRGDTSAGFAAVTRGVRDDHQNDDWGHACRPGEMSVKHQTGQPQPTETHLRQGQKPIDRRGTDDEKE